MLRKVCHEYIKRVQNQQTFLKWFLNIFSKYTIYIVMNWFVG